MPVRAIPYREPADAFAGLANGSGGHEPGSVLLDSATPGDPRSRWSYVARRPRRMLGGEEDDVLGAARGMLADAGDAEAGPAPFGGGLIGYIGYETARRIGEERRSAARHGDAWLGLFDTVAAFDTAERQAWAIGPGADDLARDLQQTASPLPPPTAEWTMELSRAEVERRIARVIAYVEAGDIYQANFTQRAFATLPDGLGPFDLYRRLRARAPGPFSAFLDAGGVKLASVSPERFVRLDTDGRLETRPIKGTRPRDPDPARDSALAAELLASAKDRAENLMIVDLMRNDLSKVAAVGSVRVPSLCALESFPAAHHLVSAVEAQLAPGLDALDLLAATLPGGSITGAPKRRAMQVIEQLEAGPRGAYCGTMLRIGFDGALDSSILIRTLTIEGSRVTAQAGGGVVADSDPAAEYAEAMVKMRPLLAALSRP